MRSHRVWLVSTLLLYLSLFTIDLALPGRTMGQETAEPDSVELVRLDSLRRIFDPVEAFSPLTLPLPDALRSAEGRPGEAYWQQRTDYSIKATLEGNMISGTETITYTNNSPDSLTSLWVQLDQNLFREDSYGAQRAEEGARHGGFFDNGGFDIGGVTLDRGEKLSIPEYRIEDTMMEVFLDEPLGPSGQKLELTVDFSFEIPERGGDRMGRLDVRRGTVYQLAQWYPRMFAYDDVAGWNQSPFLGQGEWYLEYGDFDVELIVPRDFIVLATGELQNPEEVLTSTQLDRLSQARVSEETIFVIGPDEVGDGSTRPVGEAPLTWHFRAENVRDFAWAASDRFVWDAAGWEDVLIMSAYPEESIGTRGVSGWEQSTEYLRHSVKHYSEKWYRYPYPVAINIAGLALGMEYPMIIFCSYQSQGSFLFSVTDHEIGHTWFPMIVGSDERSYAWMDEGFDTFINYYSGIDFSGGEPIFGGFMAPAQIADDSRILASIPQIEYLLSRNCKVVLLSHFGRPDSSSGNEFSMMPITARLSEILDKPVLQLPSCKGKDVENQINQSPHRSVSMLENIRFEAGETKNDRNLSRALANLADVYINDAFGVAHRAHASTEGITHYIPSFRCIHK